MLHGFDGGSHQSGDDPDTAFVESEYYTPGTGEELFGYIPGLLLPEIKMLSRNHPRSTYYVDGSPVAADAWIGDDPSDKASDEWATVLVTGFREGGPGYLALDVTDPGAVAGPHGPYPKLLWEFTHPKLGEAWSQPVITRVKLAASAGFGDHCGRASGDGDCRERWVAIFGGGYEASADPHSLAYEDDPSAAGWTDRSRALFMVALDTGELLASVEFDETGAQGPAEMKYALPSAPAVFDLDFDGSADVVYIGDLGGQVWKWDLHAKGVDSTGDSRVDNWPAGVFFRSDPVVMPSGKLRHRSFFFPPTAAFQKGKLTLAFGSGEREDLHYEGVPASDENNRFYVVQDAAPIGATAFSSLTTEADLTDVTTADTDFDLTDSGFFFVVEDGEKFVTNATIFAGYVIVASYDPESGADVCATSGGQAFLYVVDLGTGRGFLGDGDGGDPPSEDRRELIGGGLPSDPQVSVAPDPKDDKIYIGTSKGNVAIMDAPPRPAGGASPVYWRQM
jgi:type IV pilus assembly protein PilY1